MIRAICPKCKLPIQAPEEYAGQKARCPGCKALLSVPTPKTKTAAPTRPPSGPPAKPGQRPDSVTAGAAIGSIRVDDLLSEVESLATKADRQTKKQLRKQSMTQKKNPKRKQPTRRPAPATPHAMSSKSLQTLVFGVAGVVILAIAALVFYGQLTSRQAVLASREAIAQQIKKGDEFLKAKKYVEAKNAYEKALKMAQNHMTKYQDTFVRGDISTIQDLLARDEVKYGGAGYVFFEGRWIPASEKKRIEFERLAKEMKKKGYVFYQNKWVKLEDKMKAQGYVKFRGKWIRPEERTKILAEEREKERAQVAKKKTTTAKPPIQTVAAKKKGFSPDDREWMLDDFENGLTWVHEPWNDPASLDIKEINGNKALVIAYPGGKDKKFHIGRKRPINLASRDKLLVDVVNPSNAPVKIALAVLTNPGFQYFESKPVLIRPGLNPNVTFTLKKSDWKCEKSSWQYTARIENPAGCYEIVFVVYYTTPGQLVLDNVRLAKD